MKQFLLSLAEENLSEEEELKVVDVAAQTIRADNKIDYNEIKFFKVLRSNLKVVTDKTLLKKIDGIDDNYLSQDIRTDHLSLFEDYFNAIELPQFDILNISTEKVKKD